MFDFPNSPTVGQVFSPAGGPTYTWDGVKWVAGAPVAIVDTSGFINKLRNGTFDIWQRGTSAISVATTGAYAADGWLVTPTGAAVTVNRASNNRTLPNTLYGMSVVGATSVTGLTVQQRIESNIAVGLAGRTTTFQAWIYNNTGGSITPTLATQVAGTADVWSSPTTDLAATNLQPCPNATWTRVSYTWNVSANAGLGYGVILNFGNNFSTNAKNVIVAEADLRVTPGVTVGLNSSPPTPEMRHAAAEQAFCERYFRWLGFNVYFFCNSAGTAAGCPVTFPAMRAIPTIGANGPDPNTTQANLNQNSNSWTNPTPYSAMALLVAPATGTSQLNGFRAPASAEL